MRTASLSKLYPRNYRLLTLAALRGEGVLRQRFFNELMHKIPVQLDANQQILLWDNYIEQEGYIQSWVERLGIFKALASDIALNAETQYNARVLYCILLDTLAQDKPELLAWAVEGYFYHLWKNQFPDQTTTTPNMLDSDPRKLKAQLVSQLNKQFGAAVEVKESFVQTETCVQFSLRYKKASDNLWQTLHTEERPRLKQARLAVYKMALQSDGLLLIK